MTSVLTDEFASLEARDAWFGNPRNPRCACCNRRTADVGAFSDAEGRDYCHDCGSSCSAPCRGRDSLNVTFAVVELLSAVKHSRGDDNAPTFKSLCDWVAKRRHLDPARIARAYRAELDRNPPLRAELEGDQ